MNTQCPECQSSMLKQGNQQFLCSDCQILYQQKVLCPECDRPLERLQACGAVDYLCLNGDGLISKKRIKIDYLRQN